MNETDAIAELKQQLLDHGAPEGELDEIIKDVNDVIIQRTIRAYLSTINDEEVSRILPTLVGQEIIEYFEKNSSRFPPLSLSLFKEIAEKTWTEYFDYMSQ